MADTTIKLSGTYDSIEAYNILEEMRNMSSDYEEIRTEAAEAASGARAAVATAQTAVTTATTAANNAQTYAGNANDSATAAAGSASSASTAATNALDSQNAAAGSASAAATSASNASASEDSAADSATAAAASAAEVAATIQNYLPLSGGTMTGNISGSTGNAIFMPGGFFQDSDERLKIFAGDIEDALDKTNRIPTKYFYWKDMYDGPREIGTSAQKVQEIFPEIVSGDDKLSVDYSKLAIVALAAIKELSAKVDDLQRQLDELKK